MPYDSRDRESGRKHGKRSNNHYTGNVNDLAEFYDPNVDPEYLMNVLAQMQGMGATGGFPMPTHTGESFDFNRGTGAGFRDHSIAPQRSPRGEAVAQRPPVSEQQMSDMDALFQQLMGMVGTGTPQVDYEAALKDSEAAIREAYGAQIGAIRSGNKGARKDTARMRKQIEAAYKGLAKSYHKGGQRALRQNERMADQIQANSKDSANFLNSQADAQTNEMADMAKGLGIEAAMPSAVEGLQTEAARGSNRIVNQGTRDSNQMLQFGGINQGHMERGGQLARLEGTNRSVDLLYDLQNYLQANRDRIAGLKGQRASELAANQSSIMGSVAEMQQAAAEDQWNKLMDLAGLKMDINKEQFDQNSSLADYQLKLLQQQGGDPGSSFPGAENFANAQHYLQMLQQGKRGTNIFDELLGSNAMQDGTYFDNKAQKDRKMTPYAAMAQIEQLAKEQGLSSADTELLKLAIWAQMGG